MAQNPPRNPDVHFLLLAPGLGPAWFFEAARQYWHAFRPVVHTMQSPEDIALVEYALQWNESVAVTVAARRDTAPLIRGLLTERLPDVFLDPLIYDTADDLRLTLEGRTLNAQRFGVPVE